MLLSIILHPKEHIEHHIWVPLQVPKTFSPSPVTLLTVKVRKCVVLLIAFDDIW